MRKLFAVLAVSTAVLTAYSAGADFNLVEEAQKIQNKQDELTKKVADAKAEAARKYEAQKAEREAKAAEQKAEREAKAAEQKAKYEAKKAEIEAKRAEQQQKIDEKKKALDTLFASKKNEENNYDDNAVFERFGLQRHGSFSRGRQNAADAAGAPERLYFGTGQEQGRKSGNFQQR